jgi:RNA recognition motif-containing protein
MKIYIGNMSYNTTEEQLRETFGGFGEVSDVNIITDRETGRARGFAFVEMANSDEANAAIAELNGKELDGRQLTVSEARPRAEGGGRRGGGGRGGFNRNRNW